MPSKKTDNKEIIVAVISVVGAVLTAVIVNWGQYIFNPDTAPGEKTDKTTPAARQEIQVDNAGGTEGVDRAASGDSNNGAETRQGSVSQKPNQQVVRARPEPPPPPPPPPPPSDVQCGPQLDTTVAVNDLKALAQKGCHLAEFVLGKVYLFGYSGIDINTMEAFLWMKKAAEGGVAGAQHNLGYMYQEGLGVRKDVQMAWLWYGKAARQGRSESQAVFIKANKRW